MSRRTAHYSPPCHPCGPDPQPDHVALIQLDGAAKQSLERSRTRMLVTGLVFALAFLFDGLQRLVAGLLHSDRVRLADTTAFASTAFASAGAQR